MTTTSYHRTVSACLLLSVLLVAGEAQAALVSLDFNALPTSPTMSGDELPGVGTTFTGQIGPWNTLVVGTDVDDGGCCLTNAVLTAPLTTPPLLAGDGSSTLVTFQMGTNASVSSPVNYAVFHSAGTGSSNLRRDMVVLNGSTPGPLNWRIAGLIPGNSYDLVLFGQMFNNLAFNPATFTVFGNPPTLFDSQNDGNFNGVVANASGELIGSMSFPAGNASWTGLQLQGVFATVPEPSTLSLLGVGAIGLAIKTRRRRIAA